jgi:hypothetical protein
MRDCCGSWALGAASTRAAPLGTGLGWLADGACAADAPGTPRSECNGGGVEMKGRGGGGRCKEGCWSGPGPPGIWRGCASAASEGGGAWPRSEERAGRLDMGMMASGEPREGCILEVLVLGGAASAERGLELDGRPREERGELPRPAPRDDRVKERGLEALVLGGAASAERGLELVGTPREVRGRASDAKAGTEDDGGAGGWASDESSGGAGLATPEASTWASPYLIRRTRKRGGGEERCAVSLMPRAPATARCYS